MVATGKKKRYEHKITLGKGINGELIRKSFYSTKSKTDAKRKAEEFKRQYELELLCGGEPIRPHKRFKDWAIQCLELYKKPYVKANTYCGTYLLPVNKRLIPCFGDKAVDEILPIQVQGYINQISKELAPETVKKDFTILAFIMKYAVENGLCATNPASSAIRLPKIERPEKHAYTQAEYDIAYQFAASHPLGLSIMLLMETGISRSELLGLRWEDFDLEKAVLHIRQGLVAYQNTSEKTWVMESEGLKNIYRRRDVPLIDPLLLERLRSKPRKIVVSGQSVEPEYIFHSPEGQPYQPQNWNNRIYSRFTKELLAAYPELPKLSPHELRHTRATLWLAQGVSPLMVAKLLGHTDLKMLAKIYDHTSVDTLRAAITTKKEEAD